MLSMIVLVLVRYLNFIRDLTLTLTLTPPQPDFKAGYTSHLTVATLFLIGDFGAFDNNSAKKAPCHKIPGPRLF